MATQTLPQSIAKLESVHDSLAESVYETLMKAIVSGQLIPGTPLSAIQISEQLEVSRTPVQRALMLLANDGLVVNEVGRRARVAEFTCDDLFNVFEMRRLLEPRAAELAAGRMDQRHLAPLRRMADALAHSDDQHSWLREWTHFDEVFHSTIAQCCGNPLLAKDIGRYRLLHRGFNLINTDVDSLQQALQEHCDILAALESRDGEQASEAMEQHLANWQMIFVGRFASSPQARMR